MRPDAGPAATRAAPPSLTPRLKRADTWLLTATAVSYLIAAAATTVITYNLGYEDWFLYALMSLCTATVVTNYSILKPGAPSWARSAVWAFAIAVIGAWSLLLFERAQVGWVITNGEAIDHGAQGWFFVPVGLNAVCAMMLTVHMILIAPKLRMVARGRA